MLINVFFLWLVNSVFMIVGIFLNSVVIISLWRSSQLRKKLCYFTILVLSCADLMVVTIVHPVLIFCTTSAFLEKYDMVQDDIKLYVSVILSGFSMHALFVLNIERFLALTCPFFHQVYVTKRRLVILLVILMILLVSLLLVTSLYSKSRDSVLVVITIYLSFFLVLFMYLNYKMFVIAKSKHENYGSCLASSSGKKFSYRVKHYSTCTLAVICFIGCSCVEMAYSVSRLISTTKHFTFEVLLFNTWGCTLVAMNSTFNCLIFFWKNSILRREGMKIVKWFSTEKFSPNE